MRTIGELIGLSKQNEVLLLTLVGICCTIFDASIFNLHSNLNKVWDVRMDPSKFTLNVQLYIRYIISAIVIVRTFTVHLYLAFYIVMLWPAIFEERAGLLLPWLLVGSIKCLAMGAMSLCTGLYVCLVYRFSKAACWDFILTQVVDHGPSLYMWLCVLSYYRDLKEISPKIYPSRGTPSTLFDISERRRRVRGLVLDGQQLADAISDDRQLISTSTFDTLIHQLNVGTRCTSSRSLDSLMAKITAEAKKEEFLRMAEDAEDDDTLSVQEKALKSLRVTDSYVDRVKNKGRASEPIRTEFLHKSTSPSPAADALKSGPDEPSETEIKVVRLDASDDAVKERKASRLPRRSRTVATSYSSLAMKEEKAAGSDVPMQPKTASASVSKAPPADRPAMQKSKSCIQKADAAGLRVPPAAQVIFRQDGYTLAYLEKVKNETTKRIRERTTVASQSKDDIKYGAQKRRYVRVKRKRLEEYEEKLMPRLELEKY